MKVCVVAGREGRTIRIFPVRTAQQAEELAEQMIATGFKNVRITPPQ